MNDTDLTADVVNPLGWRRPASGRTAITDDTSRAAFEQAIEPLMPDLLRYFVRRVTPREDAADLLSQTLLVLWKHRARLPANSDEQRAWAYGIARKVLSNHTRKGSRRASLQNTYLLKASLSRSTPEEVSPAAEEALDALAALPGRDRELIRLIVWDGFGVGEAGAVLGMKETTARSRYARARKRLQQQLSDPTRPADHTR